MGPRWYDKFAPGPRRYGSELSDTLAKGCCLLFQINYLRFLTNITYATTFKQMCLFRPIDILMR